MWTVWPCHGGPAVVCVLVEYITGLLNMETFPNGEKKYRLILETRQTADLHIDGLLVAILSEINSAEKKSGADPLQRVQIIRGGRYRVVVGAIYRSNGYTLPKIMRCN